MKQEYDVVIVGAGPSGSAAAKVLTDKGLDVLIVEKKKLPRYKICSGIIFKRSINLLEKHFGDIPKPAFVTPNYYKGVRIWDNDKEFSNWPFDITGGGAPNVWRSEFDNWLTESSGAEILDRCKAVGFEKNGNSVELLCCNAGGELKFKCKYLISSEGGYSSLRAKLDPVFENSVDWFFGYQNYYEGSCGLDPLYYHGFLDSSLSDVYAWFNIKDDLLVFGTAVRRGHKLTPYIANFIRYLEKNFDMKLTKLKRKASCIGNDMGATDRFFLGKDNILIAGEGAGFLNMFGEGISSALATGMLAGHAICESMNSNKNAVSVYQEMAEDEIKYTKRSCKLGEKIAGRKVM